MTGRETSMEESIRQMAAEGNYSDAVKCLDDARFISLEREYAGVFALVDSALKKLKAIGVLCEIDGIRKLEVRHDG